MPTSLFTRAHGRTGTPLFLRLLTVLFYAGWNALAAYTLIVAGDVLGVRAQSRLGSEILERLWQHSWVPTQGLCRGVGRAADAAVILSDQVYFLRAWLALYQSTCRPDYLTRAVEVVDTVQQLFGAPDGGCYDTTVPRSFEAALLPREQPALDNGSWAEALLILSELTGNGGYARQAAAALSVFDSVVPGKSYLGAHSSRRMEEDEEALFLPAGAAWARARDLLTHGPVSLTLVGDSSGSDFRRLHRAALRIYAPHGVVKPLDSERDAEQIRGLGLSRAPGCRPVRLRGRPLSGPHRHARRCAGYGPDAPLGQWQPGRGDWNPVAPA